MVTWILRICAIIFSLTLFFASWNGFQENRTFERYSLKATVEPIDGYTETTQTKKKLGVTVGESKTLSAEMFFTTADKQRVKVNRNIPDKILAKFMAGEAVQVEYLPQSPATARVVGEKLSPILAALLGITVLFLTVIFWGKM